MLVVILLAILAGFAIWGYTQGMLKIAVSIISLIASILITTIFAPVITNMIKNNSQFDEKMQEGFYEMLSNNEEVNAYLSSDELAGQSVDTTKLTQISDKMNEIVEQIGEKFELPDVLVDALKDNSSNEMLSTMSEYGTTSIRDITLNIAASRLTDIVFNALMYVIILVILYIIIRMCLVFTNVLSKLPLVGETNKILGSVVGLCEGLIVVWLFFIIITAFGNTEFASNLLVDINENPILAFLYNYNPLNTLLLERIF